MDGISPARVVRGIARLRRSDRPTLDDLAEDARGCHIEEVEAVV